MLSAFCGRGEDQTQYLSACVSNTLSTKLSILSWHWLRPNDKADM
jgi:hypothetical protein